MGCPLSELIMIYTDIMEGVPDVESPQFRSLT